MEPRVILPPRCGEEGLCMSTALVASLPSPLLQILPLLTPEQIPLRGGHFLKEDISAFDAPFFSISPTEAAALDPQHRLLLETSYRALENGMISLCPVFALLILSTYL